MEENVGKIAYIAAYSKIGILVGTGSGFVISEDGKIVTNFHVIAGGDSFSVRFHKDPKEYRAKFIGGEPKKDIAFLGQMNGELIKPGKIIEIIENE